MKRQHMKFRVPLIALVLGGIACAPGFAATSDRPAEPQGYQGQAQVPQIPSQPDMAKQQGNTAAQLIQDKIQRVCKMADKDHDGSLTASEFKALQKDTKIDFKSADVGHRGRLSMQECAKALSG